MPNRQGSSFQRSVYVTNEVTVLDFDAATNEVGAVHALDLTGVEENEDFTFSENLEGDDVANVSVMDLEDGVVANWDAGIVKPVRVIASMDIGSGGTIGAVENTLVDLAVYVNELPQVSSDEGPSDVDEAALEYNIDDIIFVGGGDTIRLVLVQDAESVESDYDIPAEGEFALVPAN